MVSMKWRMFVIFKYCLLSLTVLLIVTESISSSESTISRKKRYLAFPKGSSFQVVYCWLTTCYGTEPAGIFTIGITVGLAWEIPENLFRLMDEHALEGLQARQRRDVYAKVEGLFHKLGQNKKDCLHRALCEAQQVTKQNLTQLRFIDQILHTVFSFPLVEPEDEHHENYNNAINFNGTINCYELFPCDITLFSHLIN